MSSIDELDGQRGFPSVLIVLLERKKASISELSTYSGISQTAAYNILPVLKDLNLIEEVRETEEDSRGQERKNYYLTEKGKRVSKKLKEAIEIMEEKNEVSDNGV